jgi:GNAT superfamily N-acetyltransferase
MDAGEQQEQDRPGAVIGLLYTWWRGDPMIDIAALPGLTTELLCEGAGSTAVGGQDAESVAARQKRGHQLYVAKLRAETVAYGWVATTEAEIGSLGLTVQLPAGVRYLWDFVTHPAWRGRGIYPRLLHAILVREAATAAQLWIGHDAANTASARGIAKAGFQPVGEVRMLDGNARAPGTLCFVPRGPADRAQAGAALLRLPLVRTPLA